MTVGAPLAWRYLARCPSVPMTGSAGLNWITAGASVPGRYQGIRRADPVSVHLRAVWYPPQRDWGVYPVAMTASRSPPGTARV